MLLRVADGADAEDDADDDAHALGQSFAQLQQVVQASDSQLLAALHSLSAFLIGGRYRSLTAAYQSRLVRDLLNALTETQQSPLHVDARLITQTLRPLHPPSLVSQTLSLFSPYSPAAATAVYHSLCPRLLSQHFAQQLFSSSPSIPAPTLLSSLSSSLPAPLIFDPAFLLSFAVLLPSPSALSPPSYHWLPVSALRSDLKGRLADLFACKKGWRLEEMQGWLADVLGASDSVESVLLRCCRAEMHRDASGAAVRLYVKR